MLTEDGRSRRLLIESKNMLSGCQQGLFHNELLTGMKAKAWANRMSLEGRADQVSGRPGAALSEQWKGAPRGKVREGQIRDESQVP